MDHVGSGEGQFIFKLQDTIACTHADGNDPVEKKVLKEARGNGIQHTSNGVKQGQFIYYNDYNNYNPL